MNPEEREAQQLARWLQEHPGTEPPADVSPEVLEAVYALRPELAPPARVTVGEILELVDAGPLAKGDAIDEASPASETPPTATVVRRPEAFADDDSAMDIVIHLHPTPVVEREEQDSESDIVVPFVDSLTDEIIVDETPANVSPSLWHRARPWIFGGGAVTLLAAATVLVVLLPAVLGPDGSPVQHLGSDVEGDRLDELAAAPPPPPASKVDALRQTDTATAPQAGSRELSVDIPLPATTASTERVARADAPPVPAAEPADRTSFADASGRAEAPAEDLDAVADLEEDEEVAMEDGVVTTEGTVGGLLGGEAAPEAVEEDAFDAAADEAPTRTRSAPAATVDRRDIEVTAAESVSQTTSGASPGRAEKKAEAAADDAGALASLERRARPAGTPSAPASTIKAQLDQGDTRGARDAARAAIKAGGLSNTAGADVHWVLGLSLQRLGNESGATAAYTEAIRLRGL